MDILDLFFNPGEGVCVSDSKYGYHSLPLEDIKNNEILLISPHESIPDRKIDKSEIVLMGLNPVNGFKRDSNVTSYRSFLVEIDSGSILEQKEYIDNLSLPYSCCIFSGNKSLHYGIVLDEDLLNETEYKFFAEWILEIVSKADSLTKNPTRSIRFPGNKRRDDRGLMQAIVDIKGRVKKSDLIEWLSQYPEKRPRLKMKNKKSETPPDFRKLPEWVKNQLLNGIDFSKGRNSAWFNLAINMAESNFVEEDIINILSEFYEEERDFTRKEFLGCIKSACERIK